ncbi:MAG: hypothetical protein HUU50_10915 [Candidatus Brocadiae bacterium]|nr:hypothetical protein [Candidatus Brocadiia bacterium]
MDEYIKLQGLTEEMFCKALKIKEEELKKYDLHIKVIQSPKKKGMFWEMRAFLTEQLSIPIGISEYREASVLRTIHGIKEAARTPGKAIPGVWNPPKETFLHWLESEIHTNSGRVRIEQKILSPEVQASRDTKAVLSKILLWQNNLPKIDTLKAVEKYLQDALAKTRFSSKLKSIEESYKIIQTALAFKQECFQEMVVSVNKSLREIQCFDAQRNLVINILLKPDRIQYQGQIFSPSLALRICHDMDAERRKKERSEELNQWRKLWEGIPSEYKAKIEALRKEIEMHWDKLSFLSDEYKNFFLESIRKKNAVLELRSVNNQAELNQWVAMMIAHVEEKIQQPSPANNVVLEILSLISSTPKYGIKTYAMWLGNSKAFILERKKLDEKFRGKLAVYKTTQIVEEIEKLLDMDWLEVVTVGEHHLPVLKLTQNGTRALHSLRLKAKASSDIQTLENTTFPSLTYNTIAKTDLYPDLIQDLQNGQRSAWIAFLKQNDVASEIEKWETSRMETLKKILDEKIPGWQIPVKWELAMHPKKNKALESLIEIHS